MIRKLSSVYVLAHPGFVIRSCPMADSQLTLALLSLHRRDGCSFTVLLFFLMLTIRKYADRMYCMVQRCFVSVDWAILFVIKIIAFSTTFLVIF